MCLTLRSDALPCRGGQYVNHSVCSGGLAHVGIAIWRLSYAFGGNEERAKHTNTSSSDEERVKHTNTSRTNHQIGYDIRSTVCTYILLVRITRLIYMGTVLADPTYTHIYKIYSPRMHIYYLLVGPTSQARLHPTGLPCDTGIRCTAAALSLPPIAQNNIIVTTQSNKITANNNGGKPPIFPVGTHTVGVPNGLQQKRQIAEMGTWFICGFSTGLRGEEMVLIEFAGTANRLRFLEDSEPWFRLVVSGRTKGN
jgi:hypothetical protein